MAEARTRRMRPVRALFTGIHRYVGLAMAIFLVITGLTGSLLAFYPELEAALNPQAFRVEPAGRTVLSPDVLIARVEHARPTLRVTGLELPEHPRHSTMLYFEPRLDPSTGQPHVHDGSELFVDPYDGRVLAERHWGAARLDRLHILSFLYSIHTSLHIPGRIGTVLLGIVALLWAIDCFVGFYLTLPARTKSAGRGWWPRWKLAWQIKRGASFTRLNLDIHRAGGLWFWLVTFVLALSSVALNLGDEVFKPAVRLFGALSADPFDAVGKRPSLPQRMPRIDHTEAAALGRAALSDASGPMYLGYLSYLPDRHAYWVAFRPAERESRFMALGETWVFVDADTGAVRHRSRFEDATAADTFVELQLPLHSGQAFGLPGRIVICVSGLLVAVLSITGVIIWWKKRRSKRHATALKNARAAQIASNG
jgi:uncharacterized iron-regulated membrane protein